MRRVCITYDEENYPIEVAPNGLADLELPTEGPCTVVEMVAVEDVIKLLESQMSTESEAAEVEKRRIIARVRGE